MKIYEDIRAGPGGNALTPTQLKDMWDGLPAPQKQFYQEGSSADDEENASWKEEICIVDQGTVGHQTPMLIPMQHAAVL